MLNEGEDDVMLGKIFSQDGLRLGWESLRLEVMKKPCTYTKRQNTLSGSNHRTTKWPLRSRTHTHTDIVCKQL